MPEALRTRAHRAAGAGETRRSDRVRMQGAELFLFLEGDRRLRFHVRDLGCTDLCGVTDTPLAPGQLLIVQLEEMLMPTARVIWTRRARAGLRFLNPLPPARFERLCERHRAGAAWSPAMRAGSDLYSWWTDIGQQQGGRRARLRSGGHEHPLPR